MKQIKIANSDLNVSEISLGCMRIAEMSNQAIATLIHTALDEGIDFFDHADLYANLEAETGLATGFKPVGFIEVASERQLVRARSKIGLLQRLCGHRRPPRRQSVRHMFALGSVGGEG